MDDKNTNRIFLSITDIQEQYLPISKKRIRALVSQYLHTKRIGGKIFVEREKLESVLMDEDREHIPLAFNNYKNNQQVQENN